MRKLILSLIFLVCIGSIVADDPPKEKKSERDTLRVRPQQQRSINIDELEQLNKMFDSLNVKRDTLIKK